MSLSLSTIGVPRCTSPGCTCDAQKDGLCYAHACDALEEMLDHYEVDTLIEEMELLTEAERLVTLSRIRARFCFQCGGEQPTTHECYCTKDE